MGLDWSELGNWSKFQSLCREILVNAGYSVEERAPGGSDLGRDLSIIKASTNLIDFHRSEIYWIECKYSKNQTLSVRNLRESIWIAVPKTVFGIAIFTNSRLSNTARDEIRLFNTSRLGKFVQVGYLSGDDLAEIILSSPHQYRDFFPSLANTPPKLPSEGMSLHASIIADAVFPEDVENVSLHVSNRSIHPQKISVRIPGRAPEEIQLPPCQTVTRTIGRHEVHHEDWEAIKVEGPDGTDCVREKKLFQDPSCHRIDAIFIDAFNIRERAKNILGQGLTLLILGSPGTGKSRVLQELSKESDSDTISIDMSSGGYHYSLFDHLISRFLDIPVTALSEVSNAVGSYAYNHTVGLSKQDWQSLSRILLGNPDAADVQRVTQAIITYFRLECVHGTKLIIDNIHSLNSSDIQLLDRMLQSMDPDSVILAARSGSELKDGVISVLRRHQDSMRTIDFTETDTRLFVERHIDKVFTDDLSRAFITKFRRFDSVQEYMLFLKMLKAKSIVKQEVDGRIRVVRSFDGAARDTYLGLIEDLITPLKERFGASTVDNTLDLAAACGYAMPVDLLLNAKPGSDELIEALIRTELLLEQASGTELRFDHELTQEALYHRRPEFVRQRHHRVLYQALIAATEGTPEGALKAHHAEMGRLLPEAFTTYLRHGAAMEKRFRARDANDAYVGARRVEKERGRIDTGASVQELKTLLIGLARTGSVVSGALSIKDMARELDVLSFENSDSEGMAYAAFYIGKAFEAEINGNYAIRYLGRAIDLFGQLGCASEKASALAARGNVRKKCFSDYIGALYDLRSALRLFRHCDPCAEAANAIGLVGGTLIESGKERKAINWYRKSVELARRLGDTDLLCFRQIAFSFLLALTDPLNPETERELELAISLAQRTGSAERRIRAKVNAANWFMFHGNRPNDAGYMLDECARACASENFNYLGIMVDFSRWMLQHITNITVEEEDPFDIFTRLMLNIPNLLTDDGRLDARSYNIIRFMIRRGHTKATAAVRASSSIRLRRLLDPDTTPEFKSFERGLLFVTYY